MATEASERTDSNQSKTGTNGKDQGGTRARSSNRSAGRDGESTLFGGSTGALIGAAAAGVAVGLMANLGRKVAVQAPTKLAGEWDEALKAEHAAVLKLFDALQATTEKNTTKRSMLLMQIKHALAKHALQEENAIYPALRDAGQTEQADHLNHDHGYVKQYLYDLENMPKESPAFLTKVAEFRGAIEEHAGEEETTIFPALKGKLSPEKNKALTALMNKEGFKLA
jgi:hemerythrin superfamily protein